MEQFAGMEKPMKGLSLLYIKRRMLRSNTAVVTVRQPGPRYGPRIIVRFSPLIPSLDTTFGLEFWMET